MRPMSFLALINTFTPRPVLVIKFRVTHSIGSVLQSNIQSFNQSLLIFFKLLPIIKKIFLYVNCRIRFTIVSEPPEESENDECEDVGIATVSVKEILDQGKDVINQDVPSESLVVFSLIFLSFFLN